MTVEPLIAPWLADIQYRTLVKDDLPALEWDGEYAHFRRLYREIYRSACQGRALMWVVTLPDKGLIGQVFVQLTSQRLELADGSSRAYIYGFRVKEAYRSAGVGSRLLQVVEADLGQRGFQQISLNVGQANDAARRFYERHGYQVVGAEAGRWHYLDEQGRRQEVHEPAWRMEKRF